MQNIHIESNNTSLHDSIIWGLRFDDNLYFDIDYLKNTLFEEEETYYYIQPLTLIFEDVENLSINVNCDWVNGLEIDSVKIQKDLNNYEVKFILQEGTISFSCKIYNSFLKKKEIKADNMALTEEERGGYNFFTNTLNSDSK